MVENGAGHGFYFLLNGIPTELADEDGVSGSPSFAVAAGDVFGFRVTSEDNEFGEGIATIRDFSAPGPDVAAVPEPASLLLLGTGLAGMAGRRWRQRKRA